MSPLIVSLYVIKTWHVGTGDGKAKRCRATVSTPKANVTVSIDGQLWHWALLTYISCKETGSEAHRGCREKSISVWKTAGEGQGCFKEKKEGSKIKGGGGLQMICSWETGQRRVSRSYDSLTLLQDWTMTGIYTQAVHTPCHSSHTNKWCAKNTNKHTQHSAHVYCIYW